MVTVQSPWKVSHGRQGGARAPGASGHFTNDTAEAFTRLWGRQWVTRYANPWHGFPLAFLPLQFALYFAELAAELHGRISLPLHVPFPLLRMLFPPLFTHQTLIHHSSLQPGALF